MVQNEIFLTMPHYGGNKSRLKKNKIDETIVKEKNNNQIVFEFCFYLRRNSKINIIEDAIE